MKVLAGLVYSEAPLLGWQMGTFLLRLHVVFPLCVLTLVSLIDLIYLFVAVLGLCCCVGYSLVAASRALLIAVLGLLIAVASLVEHGLWDAWAL